MGEGANHPQPSARLEASLTAGVPGVNAAVLCCCCVQVFKRLFPPDLFAMFIDIGHYNTALAAYTELVQKFDGG